MTTRSVPARVYRVEAGWIWIKDYRGMDITFTVDTIDDLIRELTEISDRQKGDT